MDRFPHQEKHATRSLSHGYEEAVFFLQIVARDLSFMVTAKLNAVAVKPTFETKNLSVNNIDVQLHFSEHNNGCGQMIEGEKAAIKFLESHEQLTESIKPTVRDLDNPALGSLLGITLQFKGFLSSSFDMWDVAMLFKNFQGRSAGISSVGTQVLAPPLRRLDTLDHHGFQHGAKLRDVMPVSPGHDE